MNYHFTPQDNSGQIVIISSDDSVLSSDNSALLFNDLNFLLSDGRSASDNSAMLTEEQILKYANNNYRLPTWQALPIILLPDFLLNRPRNLRPRHPIAQKQIQDQYEKAKRDPTERRINRDWMPYFELYILDTPNGQRFRQIANAIGQIPLHADVVPRTQDQVYWLKTLHYFYQARGILLAQRLYPLEIDNLYDNNLHLLQHNLPDGAFERVEHFANVNHKEIQLIAAIFDPLRNRLPNLAEKHSFDDHFRFFVKMQTERFKEDWEYTVNNRDRLQPRTAHEERDEIDTIQPLLEQSPWVEERQSSLPKSSESFPRVQRLPYKTQEQKQTNYFKEQGLYGQMILTVQDLHLKGMDSEWSAYMEAINQAKLVYRESIFWLNGKPKYKCQPSVHQRESEIDQPDQRSTWKPVRGVISPQGYLTWQLT